MFRSSKFDFNFTVPRTFDVVDKDANKTVVYYEFELTINRTDRGVARTHVFTGEERFRKRWSELDAFDKEWSAYLLKQDPSCGDLIQDLRLDPFKISKLTGPLMPNSSVKPKRQQRFAEYVNACMSESRLYHHLARFLNVPLEVLAPPFGWDAEVAKSDVGAGSSAAASASDAVDDLDDKPLQYTHRKVRRKKVDDDDGVDISSVALSSPVAINSSVSPVSPVPSGGSASMYRRDGVTPNPNWNGPTKEEWGKLTNIGLLKLPHSSGFLKSSKPKLRHFNLLPLHDSKAQALITEGRKDKRSTMFDSLHPDAYLFTYDSNKDVFDSIFLLGDPNVSWSVTFDQSSGQFAKLSKESKSGESPYHDQASLSLTITYQQGKTLDLIAKNEEDYLLVKNGLNFIRWRQDGIIKK